MAIKKRDQSTSFALENGAVASSCFSRLCREGSLTCWSTAKMSMCQRKMNVKQWMWNMWSTDSESSKVQNAQNPRFRSCEKLYAETHCGHTMPSFPNRHSLQALEKTSLTTCTDVHGGRVSAVDAARRKRGTAPGPAQNSWQRLVQTGCSEPRWSLWPSDHLENHVFSNGFSENGLRSWDMIKKYSKSWSMLDLKGDSFINRFLIIYVSVNIYIYIHLFTYITSDQIISHHIISCHVISCHIIFGTTESLQNKKLYHLQCSKVDRVPLCPLLITSTRFHEGGVMTWRRCCSRRVQWWSIKDSSSR